LNAGKCPKLFVIRVCICYIGFWQVIWPCITLGVFFVYNYVANNRLYTTIYIYPNNLYNEFIIQQTSLWIFFINWQQPYCLFVQHQVYLTFCVWLLLLLYCIYWTKIETRHDNAFKTLTFFKEDIDSLKGRHWIS
jgi:hypothetical protein